MQFVAVLCLLGLVAADPQLILSSSSPLLTPTIKTDGGLISTYTATFPHAGVPTIRAPLPYSLGYSPYSIPTLLAGNSAVVTTTRQKRSADPEPAINFPSTVSLRTASTPAATIPTTLATVPTTLATIPTNYQYTGLPAAVPYSPLVGAYPFTTGLGPYTTGLTPYTTNWPFLQAVVTNAKLEIPKVEAVTRSKRSADPKADPQLVTTSTGVTGFTYPAVNTGTLIPRTYSYTNIPINHPTQYISGHPFNTLPLTTVYG